MVFVLFLLFWAGVCQGSSPASLRSAFLSVVRRQVVAPVLSVATAFVASASGVVSSSPSSSRTALKSDEVAVTYEGGYLGLGLSEVSYRGSVRVIVDAVKNDAPVPILSIVRPGMILVSVNGDNVEGYRREAIATRIQALPSKSLIFRDPDILFSLLNSTSADTPMLVTTSILPASKNGSRQVEGMDGEQVLRVERVERAPGFGLRSAATGDVLEVSFRLLRGKEVLESSGPALLPAGAPMSQETQFFVLGANKHPVSTALLRPEGLLLLRGMCVGERRDVDFPPTYSADGKAPLHLEVRLLSINGVA